MATILLAVFLFAWGPSKYASYLASHRPKQPDPDAGLVVERKFKGGSSVFITPNDAYLETSITLGSMVLFVAGALAFKRYSSKGEA